MIVCLQKLLRTLVNSWYLFSLAAALYAYGQVWQPLTHLHSNDFKHIYLGTQAIWSGRDPYSAPSLLDVAKDFGLGNAALNPYVYLPFTGIALGFLKFFPFPTAALLWFFINHSFLLFSFIIWARLLAENTTSTFSRLGWFNILLLLASISHPLSRTLTAGQLNIVLLFCYVMSFWALRKHWEFLAGAIIGFASVFKLAPAVFALYFLLLRRVRALLAMALTSAVLLLLSIAIAGWRMHRDFLPVLAQMGYGKSTWQEYGATFWKDPWNQSLNSFFTHLMVEANRVTVSWFSGTQVSANIFTIVASAVLVALFSAAAWQYGGKYPRANHASEERVREALFLATLLLSLLLPSLLWDHYLVVLLLPVSWLIAVGIERNLVGIPWIALLCYMLTAMPVRLDAESFRHGLGVLLMSSKLYPTLIIFGLLLRVTYQLQKSCSQPSDQGEIARKDR